MAEENYKCIRVYGKASKRPDSGHLLFVSDVNKIVEVDFNAPEGKQESPVWIGKVLEMSQVRGKLFLRSNGIQIHSVATRSEKTDNPNEYRVVFDKTVEAIVVVEKNGN